MCCNRFRELQWHDKIGEKPHNVSGFLSLDKKTLSNNSIHPDVADHVGILYPVSCILAGTTACHTADGFHHEEEHTATAQTTV